MIVLAYDCDSEYLKVLFSSKISGNGNISIEHNVSASDSRVAGKKVPVLLKNAETFIETGNAIVLHLLPPPDELKESANTWIQWEHTQLSPQLILFGNGEGSEDNLTSLLGHLEQFLTNNYLLGDVISAADICVGCALYPLLSDYNEHSQNLFSSFNNIVSWFNRISSLPEFKECEKKVEVGLNSLPKSRSSDFEEITKNSVEEIVKIWENCATSCRPKPKERIKPVLPKPGEKNVLITSALPYVNNVPHLGNIIGCVLSADVFSRFCRLRNWNTLFICGTDEYGTATETKALDEGLTPQEICDKYFAIHSEIYQWFNIDFDLFGRTTTQNQKEVVQQMFKDCYDNGYTLTEVMDQLLCENCDRFLADRFVEGICPKCKFVDARGDQCDGCGQLINAVELIEPKCKQCRNTPVVRQSQQLFLDLPKIEPKLKEWIEKTSKGWTHNARVITKSWLREGLKPRCITRDLKWGIPVPLSGFESKVFYVWFDAPIGYMSMTKSYTDEWLNWWKPSSETPVSLYQFMAKDNVPFHSIMFPATLFATQQNFITVNHLMATEYLNYEDGKFSKSRGVGVFGTDAKETGIPSDIYRFYLLYVRPESQDSSFSWADLAAKNNTDLLNNLGNFVNRALMFSAKFFNSEIPQITLTDEEKQLIGIITRELVCYVKEIECGRLREGVKYLLNISRHGNQYIQANQPWVLIKGSAEEKERAGTVTGFACQLVCLLTVLLHPYMPEASDTLKKQTNFPEECFVIPDKFLPYLLPGHKIGKPVPLFTKIEPATVEALKQKYAGKQKSSTPEKTLEPEMSVEELEKAIENQGQLVRSLKESGKGKDVWQPEVTKLLDLKKSLANLSANKTSIPNGAPVNVAELEKMVSEQGEKVRVLKQGGSDKAAIKDEVSILLDLKNKLSLAKGEPVQTSGKKKKK